MELAFDATATFELYLTMPPTALRTMRAAFVADAEQAKEKGGQRPETIAFCATRVALIDYVFERRTCDREPTPIDEAIERGRQMLRHGIYGADLDAARVLIDIFITEIENLRADAQVRTREHRDD